MEQRYIVLEYLAEGGMGAIFKGKKLGAGGFEKEVVLKQLLPEYMQQPEFIDLFLREARLTATLDHANIVHTIDLVRAADEYFMVMEYVRGGDLRTLLKRAKRRKQRVHPAAALFVAREVLSALAYAHQKLALDGRPLGLIHRDVSPSNILVSGAGEVKLTDFGIAKATTHHSVFYRVKGKVGYMSPEQARNQELDPRSDLYSVGVILYEMLTGERLLVSAGLTVTPEQVYGQPVPRVSEKNDALPAELDGVMKRALAVDPAERFQTAGEMRESLLRIAHRNGLMWGAPDVARHLVEACGPVAEWGSVVIKEPPPERRDGTELTFSDGPGTQKLPAIEVVPEPTVRTGPQDLSGYLKEDSDELLWVDELERGGPRNPTGPHKLVRPRHDTHNSRVSDFAGLELTSMLDDFGAMTQVGAKPLVDLSEDPPPPAPETERVERLEHLEDPPEPDDHAVEMVALAASERRRLLIATALAALASVGLAAGIGLSGDPLVVEAPRVPTRAQAVATAPAVASLQVTSEPPRARVSISGEPVPGGKPRCTTPCTLEGLPIGMPLVLRVEREGHLPWSALVVPAAGGKQVAKLRRAPPAAEARDWGSVQLHTSAPRAVLVAGEAVGHLSTSGPLPLPPGETLLTLVGSDGSTTEIKVDIRPREMTTVDLTSQ